MRTNVLKFGVDGVWSGEQSESAGEARAATSKVPQVAIAFWIIKKSLEPMEGLNAPSLKRKTKQGALETLCSFANTGRPTTRKF
jgi:hypothetical protein